MHKFWNKQLLHIQNNASKYKVVERKSYKIPYTCKISRWVMVKEGKTQSFALPVRAYFMEHGRKKNLYLCNFQTESACHGNFISKEVALLLLLLKHFWFKCRDIKSVPHFNGTKFVKKSYFFKKSYRIFYMLPHENTR